MITENLSTLKIHKLSQEQYDRELAAGNIDENAISDEFKEVQFIGTSHRISNEEAQTLQEQGGVTDG